MSTDKIKLSIIEFIVKENDPESLERLRSLVDDLEFEKKSAAQVIGTRANGMEVTKAELLRCVRIAEEQLERGETLTLDDLDAQSETW